MLIDRVNSTSNVSTWHFYTWEVIGNSTTVRVNATLGNDTSVSFGIDWGSIREMTPQGKLIKSVNPVTENWLRSIEKNSTTAVIVFSTVETRPPWQDQPVAIALTVTLGLQARSKSLTNAKFSLSVDGDWKFEDPKNTLDVDLIVRGAFHNMSHCGKTRQFRIHQNSEDTVYRFGADSSTGTSVSILRNCVADSVTRTVSSGSPVVFDNNTAVNITIRFPSFKSSLYYDPNFALLLGFTGDWSCDPLLTWILPAAFLGGAALIVLLVILIYRPRRTRPAATPGSIKPARTGSIRTGSIRTPMPATMSFQPQGTFHDSKS